MERGNRLVCAALHCHESKTTQTTRLSVLNQTDVFNDAKGAKELSNLFRRHIEWEMININICRHTDFLSTASYGVHSVMEDETNAPCKALEISM
jgi:hypothetical protein